MDSEPCVSESVRLLVRNNPDALRTCVARVRGLSQTCDVYDRCGPSETSNDRGTRGICGRAGTVDYYLEPEVERMCGVCDMFRAIVPTDFVSPRAGYLRKSMGARAAHNSFPLWIVVGSHLAFGVLAMWR